MLVLDVALIVILVGALLIGVQRGFFASLGAVLGLVAGGIAAWFLMPWVTEWVPSTPWRGIAAIASALLLLLGGAALGGALGRVIRRGADRIKLRVLERFLGGIVNTAAAALALSFVGHAIAATGIPLVSSAVASSSVLRTIDALTPPPVRTALAEARGAVIDDGLPQLGALLQPALVGPAPDVALDDPALTAAAQSVARITGTAFACGTTSTGSGFAVEGDLLVTNAHVVAGVETPVVELPGQAAREGRVVYFDPIDDLAVVQVDDLGATALPTVPTLALGAAAVVQGYPYGGPFVSGAAQVTSVGTVPVPDISGDASAPREIYALDAVVRPGNSGGPLLTPAGEVAGVVFARADDGSDVGYAMTTTELLPVLAQADAFDAAVDTGTCTA